MIALATVDEGKRNMDKTYPMTFAATAVMMTIPSGLLGLIFGPAETLAVLTGATDSGGLWVSALSYLAMLVGSIIVISGVTRRSSKQTSFGLIVMAAGWAGAAWNRHREAFTEWTLVVAAICLILSALILVYNRSHSESSA